MYCKLFASLYQGTLRGKAHEILVFTNLLANADKFGHVDKHFKAIAEEVGLTREEVEAAIVILESPDPESRSPEANGCRLQKLDGHRAWGWKIVNHGKYRAIKNEDDRREQNRLAQERWRAKQQSGVSNSKQPVSSVSIGKPISAHVSISVSESLSEGTISTPVQSNGTKGSRFVKPTKAELELEASKIGLPLSQVESFLNHYESNGWKVGKNPMRSWTHAMANWKTNLRNFAPKSNEPPKQKAKFLL